MDLSTKTPEAVWLSENDVVDAVVAHLVAEGWEVLSSASTLQHGIDILASRVAEPWQSKPRAAAPRRPGRVGLDSRSRQGRRKTTWLVPSSPP